MADHDAIIADFVSLADDPPSSTDTIVPAEALDRLIVDPVEAANEGSVNRAAVPGSHLAWESSGEYPHDIILNEIYFSPTEINVGFIIDPSSHQVRIWSTFSVSKEISSIEEVSPLGTELIHETVPIALTGLSEKLHTLTVLKDGPPFQDSKYIYTIGSTAYELSVTGTRVLSWTWDTAWTKNVVIRYKFQTIIHQNKRFVEQRRPLLDKLTRELSAEFLELDLSGQKFINDLRKLSTKVLAIPIYPELIRPSAGQTLQGATLVNVVDNLNEFWNLKNGTTVVLLKSSTLSELKEVATIGSNSISFTSAIAKAFQVNDTIIYPAFIGIIQSKEMQLETSRMVRANIEFREIL